MTYRNGVWGVAVALMIGLSVAVAGCGKEKVETPPPSPSYGVADLETLVKAHPKYSTYFRLETEYNHMLEQYQNERNKLIHASAQQRQIRAALADQSQRMAAEDEIQTKVKAKENELNDGLKALYTKINEAHQKQDKPVTMDGLTPEERAEMANLQMKLTVLGVTGDEKEDVKKKLHDLMNLRISREQVDTAGWTQDEIKEMQEAKEKASKELDAYAAKTAEEIKAGLAQPEDMVIAPEEEPVDPSWNEDWQQRIDAKQKQMADLKKEIMKDIEEDAAQVASDKHLVMIFSKYKANVSAVDVTSDIVNRVVSGK